MADSMDKKAILYTFCRYAIGQKRYAQFFGRETNDDQSYTVKFGNRLIRCGLRKNDGRNFCTVGMISRLHPR